METTVPESYMRALALLAQGVLPTPITGSTGNFDVGADLEVVGDSTLAGDLDVEGDTTLEGDAEVDGDAAVTGTLEVTGISTLGEVHAAVVTGLRKVIAGGASYLVTTADSGAVIQTADDNAIISLPNITAGMKGLEVTIQNNAADGGAGITISPDASDKIKGTIGSVSASGTAGKDWINAKGGQILGDCTVLMADGTDTWRIMDGQGIWASEQA
jgi:hypothetical protein